MARLLRVCTDAVLSVLEAAYELLQPFQNGFPCGYAIWAPGETHPVWMSHGDRISRPPEGFKTLAATDSAPFAAVVAEVAEAAVAAKKQLLDDIIRPVVEGLGYECWGIDFVSQGKHSTSGSNLFTSMRN